MTLRVDGLAVRTMFAVALALLAGPAFAQRITEFQIPNTQVGFLTSIAPGPDGALWYPVRFENRIDRITTAGAVTPFSFPGDANVVRLTAGPDGALWVSNRSQSIRRMTTTGQFTEFPVGVTTFDITTGSDGALWFTYEVGVGRLATDGTVTLYDGIPAAFIVPGPDGALWVLGHTAPALKLTRITTSGSITEFPLPVPGTLVGAFVVGPDGAFWLTLDDNNKIARVTSSGSYSEFVVPTPSSRPVGIASGPDGALWFTEYIGNRIGRITTSGAITEFPVPTFDSGPYGITMGSDGNLWFVEEAGGAVARVDPNRPAGQGFFSLTPCRVVDTRDPPGPLGGPALERGVRRDFNLTGVCGVPAGAVAVAANITAIEPTSAGDLQGFAPDFFAPRSSLLNFSPGRVRAGNGVLKLGPFGDLTLLCGMLSAGNVHVVVDVVGYFD